MSIRKLSRLWGKLSSSIQAVFPAPLHYRFLLMAKTTALKKLQVTNQHFLNQATQEELLWWWDHLAAWNGRPLLRKKDNLLIETDCLELMAGGFAIKYFCKNRASIQVKLLMDNNIAIASINSIGGSSPVLASLVYETWQLCLEREISLTAHHIPGIYNAADREWLQLGAMVHEFMLISICQCQGNIMTESWFHSGV